MEYGEAYCLDDIENFLSKNLLVRLNGNGDFRSKENKLWLGIKSEDTSFTVPADYEQRVTRSWIDDEGQKWRSMDNIC